MPSRTESRSPGESEASDGVPQAAASITVMPHPSFGEGNTFATAPRKSASLVASSTKPRKRTASPSPRVAASASSRGRSSPLPAMSSVRSGRWRRASSSARNSSSTPLYRLMRPT